MRIKNFRKILVSGILSIALCVSTVVAFGNLSAAKAVDGVQVASIGIASNAVYANGSIEAGSQPYYGTRKLGGNGGTDTSGIVYTFGKGTDTGTPAGSSGEWILGTPIDVADAKADAPLFSFFNAGAGSWAKDTTGANQNYSVTLNDYWVTFKDGNGYEVGIYITGGFFSVFDGGHASNKEKVNMPNYYDQITNFTDGKTKPADGMISFYYNPTTFDMQVEIKGNKYSIYTTTGVEAHEFANSIEICLGFSMASTYNGGGAGSSSRAAIYADQKSVQFVVTNYAGIDLTSENVTVATSDTSFQANAVSVMNNTDIDLAEYIGQYHPYLGMLSADGATFNATAELYSKDDQKVKEFGVTAGQPIIFAHDTVGAYYIKYNMGSEYLKDGLGKEIKQLVDITLKPEKSEASMNAMFSGSADNVYAQANYLVPNYVTSYAESQRNGIALHFPKEGGVITSNKVYSVSDLAKGIKLINLPTFEGASTANIQKLFVKFTDQKTGKAIVYDLRPTIYAGWAALNYIGIGAHAIDYKYENGEQVFDGEGNPVYVEQTSAGFANNGYDSNFLRGLDKGNGFVGAAGFYTPKNFITFKYVQDGAKCEVYSLPSVNYAASGLVRDLGNMKVKASSADGSNPVIPSEDISRVNGIVAGGEDAFEFSGFDADAELILSIGVQQATSESLIFVPEICGENMACPISVVHGWRGAVNCEYTIPTPDYYVNNQLVPFDKQYRVYKIVDGAEQDVVALTDFVAGESKFTPTEEGTYYVEYVSITPTLDSSALFAVSVESDDAAGTLKPLMLTLQTTAESLTAYDKYLDNIYKAGATTSSDIYEKDFDRTKLVLNIYVGGALKATYDDRTVLANLNLLLADLGVGTYKFEYIASDDAGRELVKIVEFDITRHYIVLTGEFVNEEDTFGKGDENIKDVTKADVDVSDYEYGLNFYDKGNNLTVTVMVKKPGEADFTEYPNGFAKENFDLFGEYEIKYVVNYDELDAPAEILRTVNIIDNSFPVITLRDIKDVFNVSEDDRNVSTSTNKFYKGLTGTEIYFGRIDVIDVNGLKEDVSDDLKLSLVLEDGSLQAIEKVDGVFKYAFNKAGNYIFVFTVSDYLSEEDKLNEKANNTTKLSYNIEVRDKWIKTELKGVPVSTATTEEEVVFSDFTVVDLFGNAVSDATKTIEVSLNGAVVKTISGTGAFKPVVGGNYVVTFKASRNGEVADDVVFNIAVADKTKPVIKLTGTIQTTGEVGTAIPLPQVSVTDNQDASAYYVIDIKLGDREINYMNGQFTVIEDGEYTVTITAYDASGNSSAYTYTVTVGKSDRAINGAFVIGAVGVLMIIAAGVLFFLKSRKK